MYNDELNLYLEYVHSLIRRKKTKNELKYVQYSD